MCICTKHVGVLTATRFHMCSRPFTGKFYLILGFLHVYLKADTYRVVDTCLNTGHFPSEWCIGFIVPIPKSGDDDK